MRPTTPQRSRSPQSVQSLGSLSSGEESTPARRRRGRGSRSPSSAQRSVSSVSRSLTPPRKALHLVIAFPSGSGAPYHREAKRAGEILGAAALYRLVQGRPSSSSSSASRSRSRSAHSAAGSAGQDPERLQHLAAEAELKMGFLRRKLLGASGNILGAVPRPLPTVSSDTLQQTPDESDSEIPRSPLGLGPGLVEPTAVV
mmetsp:Transcript_140137/g.314758  ORF Transcript_140137/g.314758 Transcript_140137/m.314758 type:complete len:200 (+) Transcript_140137:37-636(+)